MRWTVEHDYQVIAMAARGMSYAAIGERLGVGKNAICGRVRRLRDMGVEVRGQEPGITAECPCGAKVSRPGLRCTPCGNAARVRPMPADLCTVAPGKGLKALAAHYRTSTTAVKRWCDASGLERLPHGYSAERTAKPKPAKRNPVNPFGSLASRTVERHQHRDASTAGQAAEHLQRTAPVYRCDEVGRADPKGSHWRYGSIVLTPDELIARAERKGFDPNAWSRLTPSPATRASSALLPVGPAGSSAREGVHSLSPSRAALSSEARA